MFPRPPSPPLPPIFPSDAVAAEASVDRHSYNPSILIIAAIVASAIVAAASIHLLLRVLSRSRSRPVVHHLDSSSSLSSSPSISDPSPPSDQDPKAVIDSLPLFSLSSSTAAKSPSPLDCAVCLSPFQPSDELRLLPSCRHAFHSQCIDTWLKTSLSCPLCRAPIRPISNPPPPTPPAAESTRSESFRVEIGSVSRRTDESSTAAPHDPPVRSFSLGSSFEYVVEEEIEAVLSRVRRRTAAEKSDLGSAVVQPGDSVAEIAGVSHRSWLKEYVDRLTSSASSSFSSLRFSQRVSHGGGSGVSEGWDLERNLHLHLEEDDGGFSAFYRWLVGA